MELSKTNTVGMQDMGAAGIICSTSEMSSPGNCGMKINQGGTNKTKYRMNPSF